MDEADIVHEAESRQGTEGEGSTARGEAGNAPAEGMSDRGQGKV